MKAAVFDSSAARFGDPSRTGAGTRRPRDPGDGHRLCRSDWHA